MASEIYLQDAVIVLDNHACHRSYAPIQLLLDLGASALHLPSSTSFLNPIESVWGLYKRKLRMNLLNPDSQMLTD